MIRLYQIDQFVSYFGYTRGVQHSVFFTQDHLSLIVIKLYQINFVEFRVQYQYLSKFCTPTPLLA